MLLLGVAFGGTILFLFDPAAHAFYPFCPLHRFTGLQCAGCGTLRALHQLSHGYVVEALHLNALTVLALPFLLWWLSRQLIDNLTNRKFSTTELPVWSIWTIFAILMAFTVIRNLPFEPFTWLAI